MKLRFAMLLAFMGSLWQVTNAAAEPLCDDLPNSIYLQVGDTQEPLMKALGRALANSTVRPVTLIYTTSGSCTNVEAIYQGIPITVNPKYVPSKSDAPDWKTSDASPTCTIATGGHAVDVANSALFVSACNPDDPPAGVRLFQGPVQAYVFVVPEASTQRAITAEEAYFVFGFGNDDMVTPWNDEAFMFIRPVTKSTLLSLAAAIRVPGAKWRGTPFDKSSDVLNAVASSTSPEKTIGILGAEIYDSKRDTINTLAYRAYGQRHAYYPDSTSTAFDKRNLRDGHYLPWAPTVWLTHVDSEGKPTNDLAAYIIDLILANQIDPQPEFEPLDIVIGVGLVPDCAMKVTRSYEAGELSLYEPQEPCGCYYDSKVGTAPESCIACSLENPCEKGVCRHGFCEER
jgi:hypothetical protein